MRNLLITSVLALICLVGLSIHAEEKEMGIVTGKVKFSPVRPGPVRLNEPEDPEILRRIYANHRVRVLAENGKKLIRELEINSQGIYKTELEPGIYFLQVTPPSMGKFQKQPQRVEVTAGKTINVDISVDTGMR
jgi:hypothetical protein